MKTHISSKSTLGSNSTKSSHNRFSLSFQMNILKEITDNSTSQFFVKFQKIFPHKYSFLPPQKNLESIIYKNFKGTYSNDKNFYNVKVINEIICNDTTHIVAEFKDYLIIGDYSEFLQKYYKLKESLHDLPKIYEYYETCSVIFPNYVILPESKYIYKNIQRKQRVIDNQQELEEEQEKLKKLNNQKINDFSDSLSINSNNNSDCVFNTQAIDSILNQTDSSAIRNFFGIKNNNNSLIGIKNIINEIEKNENKDKKIKINLRKNNNINNINKNKQIKNNSNNNNHKNSINYNKKLIGSRNYCHYINYGMSNSNNNSNSIKLNTLNNNNNTNTNSNNNIHNSKKSFMISNLNIGNSYINKNKNIISKSIIKSHKNSNVILNTNNNSNNNNSLIANTIIHPKGIVIKSYNDYNHCTNINIKNNIVNNKIKKKINLSPNNTINFKQKPLSSNSSFHNLNNNKNNKCLTNRENSKYKYSINPEIINILDNKILKIKNKKNILNTKKIFINTSNNKSLYNNNKNNNINTNNNSNNTNNNINKIKNNNNNIINCRNKKNNNNNINKENLIMTTTNSHYNIQNNNDYYINSFNDNVLYNKNYLMTHSNNNSSKKNIKKENSKKLLKNYTHLRTTTNFSINNNINNSNKKSKKKNNMVLQSKKDIKVFEINGFKEIIIKKNKNLTSRNNFNCKIISNSERVSSKNSSTNIMKNKIKINNNKIEKLLQLLHINNKKF